MLLTYTLGTQQLNLIYMSFMIGVISFLILWSPYEGERTRGGTPFALSKNDAYSASKIITKEVHLAEGF